MDTDRVSILALGNMPMREMRTAFILFSLSLYEYLLKSIINSNLNIYIVKVIYLVVFFPATVKTSHFI